MNEADLLRELRGLRLPERGGPGPALLDAVDDRPLEKAPAVGVFVALAFCVATTRMRPSGADRLFGPGVLKGAALVIERTTDRLEDR